MSTDRDNKIAAADVVEFEPVDRASFLLKGAMAAGALFGAGAVGSVVSSAFAQSSDQGDIEILNFALTLEYLEADFYDQALKAVDLPGDVEDLVKEIGSNEQEHVAALTATIEDLGGEPAKEPKFNFDLSDKTGFLDLAVTLEDTGVSAYNGAGPLLKSKELLATAGSIVQIEGRHAAAVRMQNGDSPVVAPFDQTLDMEQVLKAVQPFIAS